MEVELCVVTLDAYVRRYGYQAHTLSRRGLWFFRQETFGSILAGSAGSLRVGPCLIPTLFDRPMRSFGPCALGCRDSFGTG